MSLKAVKLAVEHTDMFTKQNRRTRKLSLYAFSNHFYLRQCVLIAFFLFRNAIDFSNDGKEYALKLIEGTGISMSACREIAVRTVIMSH